MASAIGSGRQQASDQIAQSAANATARDQRGRRQRWLEVCSELPGMFVSEADQGEALRGVIRRLKDVSGADYSGIVLVDPTATDDRSLTIFEGFAQRQVCDERIPRQGLTARVIESGRAFVSDDLTNEDGYDPPTKWASALAEMGLGMLLPLAAEDQVMALLLAGWRRGSPHAAAAKNEVQLVQTFADQAGLALQRRHPLHDRDRRQRWLEASSELTRLHLDDLDRDQALRHIIRNLREVSGADFAAITLLDPDGSNDTVLQILDGFASMPETKTPSYLRVPRKGLMATVLRTGTTIVSEDFTHLPNYTPRPELAEALSLVGLGILLPLASDGETLGVLFAAWQKGSPDEQAAKNELPLAATFADQAALALRRARNDAESRRRERWLQATSEMSRLLIGEVDRDTSMSMVLRQLRGISGADVTGIMLVDPADETSLSVVAFQGPGLPHIPPDTRIPRAGLIAQVIATGRAVVSDDYPRVKGHNPPKEWARALSDIGLGMAIPLTTAEEVLGVLFADWRHDSSQQHSARREAQQIQTFADLAALALHRVRTQDDHTHLQLLQDHIHLAEQLHDHVLQRLFAVSLGLRCATTAKSRPTADERIHQAIIDLDHTCDGVRDTIARLSAGDD